LTYRIAIDGLLSEFDGGESVLLDLGSQRYHRLNGTAAFLWNEIKERRHDQSSLTRALSSRYDLSEDRARASVLKFVKDLLDMRLISEGSPEEPPAG
jgi:Coenzyme PQQ synthesis protein D (PqqD)